MTEYQLTLHVSELATRLTEIPPHWHVIGTRAGSLEVYEPGGRKYGRVFTDGRPTRWYTNRQGHFPPCKCDASEAEAAP
jgi:hypothetical protein